ncbi:hypothetical protein FDP25_12625 [Roseovarius sp. A21]|uniref:DUF2946 family protein n=1 Tax=Roseovarius bejariae TaxID=2576383 RepID=A0A844CW29_9RHOB|nr:hypothetical protein [Roseovarius bejariae]
MRTYLGFALALLLALTSQTMAVARGAPAPVGQAVLCTGTGPVTVLVDADGQPTGQVHICPDCALGLFNALTPTQPDLTHDTGKSEAEAIDLTLEFRPTLSCAFAARAPPFAI